MTHAPLAGAGRTRPPRRLHSAVIPMTSFPYDWETLSFPTRLRDNESGRERSHSPRAPPCPGLRHDASRLARLHVSQRPSRSPQQITGLEGTGHTGLSPCEVPASRLPAPGLWGTARPGQPHREDAVHKLPIARRPAKLPSAEDPLCCPSPPRPLPQPREHLPSPPWKCAFWTCRGTRQRGACRWPRLRTRRPD